LAVEGQLAPISLPYRRPARRAYMILVVAIKTGSKESGFPQWNED